MKHLVGLCSIIGSLCNLRSVFCNIILKEFSSTRGRYRIVNRILENVLPWSWGFKGAALVMGCLFQNLALVMGLSSGLSQAHEYQVPYRSYPPPPCMRHMQLGPDAFMSFPLYMVQIK